MLTSSSSPAPRRGRVLIESLVALVLLGGLSALATVAVQTAATLGDDAQLIARLQQSQTGSIERRLPAACDSGRTPAPVARWQWPRLHARETVSASSAHTRLLLETQRQSSALALSASRTARLAAEIGCR